jgi:hypothetical protein
VGFGVTFRGHEKGRQHTRNGDPRSSEQSWPQGVWDRGAYARRWHPVARAWGAFSLRAILLQSLLPSEKSVSARCKTWRRLRIETSRSASFSQTDSCVSPCLAARCGSWVRCPQKEEGRLGLQNLGALFLLLRALRLFASVVAVATSRNYGGHAWKVPGPRRERAAVPRENARLSSRGSVGLGYSGVSPALRTIGTRGGEPDSGAHGHEKGRPGS